LATWEATYHLEAALSAIAQAEQHLTLCEAAQLRRLEIERVFCWEVGV